MKRDNFLPYRRKNNVDIANIVYENAKKGKLFHLLGTIQVGGKKKLFRFAVLFFHFIFIGNLRNVNVSLAPLNLDVM